MVGTLGVDSFSILFKHRSFQRPAVSPDLFDGFLKRFGSLGSEWKWKVPLERYIHLMVLMGG